jgi:hypothetical protein
MRSSYRTGSHDGNLRNRVRTGQCDASTRRIDLTQSQSLKSPSTTLLGLSIRSTSASRAPIFFNDRADAVEIEMRVKVERAVYIPRHDADGIFHVRRPLSHVTTNWTARQTAIHAMIVRPTGNVVDHETFLAKSAICAPSAAVALPPGGKGRRSLQCLDCGPTL